MATKFGDEVLGTNDPFSADHFGTWMIDESAQLGLKWTVG